MADWRMDLKRRAAGAARMEAATSREGFHMITRGRARAISRLGMKTTFLIGRPRRCGRKLLRIILADHVVDHDREARLAAVRSEDRCHFRESANCLAASAVHSASGAPPDATNDHRSSTGTRIPF